MPDLRSRPAVSPLSDVRFVQMCGWLRSAPSPTGKVAPYRRPHKVRKSRRPYFVAGKVDTVAREAAWGGVCYADLLEGMPMYGGAR